MASNLNNEAELIDSDSDDSEFDCFKCSICLSIAQNAVVTFCGHIFCGECLDKWISPGEKRRYQCPVCQSKIGQNTIIPLRSDDDVDPSNMETANMETANMETSLQRRQCISIREQLDRATNQSNVIPVMVQMPPLSLFYDAVRIRVPQPIERAKPLARELQLLQSEAYGPPTRDIISVKEDSYKNRVSIMIFCFAILMIHFSAVWN